MEKIGDKIYNLRLQHNLSQEQLGEKVGVTRQTVSVWEANKRQVNADKLKRLCEIFGVPLEYFVCEDSIDTEFNSTKYEEESIVCADLEQEAQGEIKLGETEMQVKNRKKLSPVQKKFILFAVILLLIGIAALIIGKISTPPKIGFETYSDTTYNFDVEQICWLVLGIVIALGVLLAIAIVIKYVRRKTENKKLIENANEEVKNDKN